MKDVSTPKLVIICLTAVLCSGILAWSITRESEIKAVERIEHDKERPRKFWEKEPASDNSPR